MKYEAWNFDTSLSMLILIKCAFQNYAHRSISMNQRGKVAVKVLTNNNLCQISGTCHNISHTADNEYFSTINLTYKVVYM